MCYSQLTLHVAICDEFSRHVAPALTGLFFRTFKFGSFASTRSSFAQCRSLSWKLPPYGAFHDGLLLPDGTYLPRHNSSFVHHYGKLMKMIHLKQRLPKFRSPWGDPDMSIVGSLCIFQPFQTKARNRFDLSHDMRIALSKMEPFIEDIMKENLQFLQSHLK